MLTHTNYEWIKLKIYGLLKFEFLQTKLSYLVLVLAAGSSENLHGFLQKQFLSDGNFRYK